MNISRAQSNADPGNRLLAIVACSVVLHALLIWLPFSPLPGYGGEINATLVTLRSQASPGKTALTSPVEFAAEYPAATPADLTPGSGLIAESTRAQKGHDIRATAPNDATKQIAPNANAFEESTSQSAEPGEGSNDTLAMRCPQRLAPVYPEASLRDGEEGRVGLKVRVDARGKISGVTVVASSGRARVDRAAVEFVLGWTCQPAANPHSAADLVALEEVEFTLP